MFEWKHPKHYAKLRKDFREEAEKEKAEKSNESSSLT